MICKTTAEMKEMDRVAIQERRIPSLQLMDTAAGHVAASVKAWLTRTGRKGQVLIFCGPGNNGGDGFSCAWQLLKQGVPARVCFVGKAEKMTADARTEQEKLLSLGGAVVPYAGEPIPEDAGCLVDALFGVGLDRNVGGMFARAIAAINQAREAGVPVVACDIPSGIEGNTGAVLGIAVQADETVTFSCAKPGLLAGEGRQAAGLLTVCDIGIPRDLLES